MIDAEFSERKTSQPEKRMNEVSFCQSLGAILKKDLTNTYRNPLVVKGRIFQTIFVALLVGGLYFQT